MRRGLLRGVFEIVMVGGESVAARELVLAVGNFCASSHVQFAGNEGYFESPWPLSKFQNLDPNSDIFILGSRLTAFDAVNHIWWRTDIGDALRWYRGVGSCRRFRGGVCRMINAGCCRIWRRGLRDVQRRR